MNLNLIMIATMDTKGAECGYLAERINKLAAPDKVSITIVDAGIRGKANGIAPDVFPEELAKAAGTTLKQVREMVRGEAIATMSKGAAKVAARLYDEGRCQGIVSLCGGSGGSIAGAAMEALPLGVPKIMATPLASGPREFGFYIDTKDVMVMHSVIDISGVNSISSMIYDTVAGAILGAARAYATREKFKDGGRTIGVTMIGNTTDGVDALRRYLEGHGVEVVCFHSSGVGGRAMEGQIKEGRFHGIVDYTTNEVFEDIIGGLQRGAGPERMTVAGKYGIPQIVVPGCVDIFDQGPIETLSEEFQASRNIYKHSPAYTLCQLTDGELCQVAKIFAEKLNPAKGPVKVVVPMRGFSIPGCPGGKFDNPEGVRRFADTIKENLREGIEVVRFDAHVNDEAFAEAVAKLFLQMFES